MGVIKNQGLQQSIVTYVGVLIGVVNNIYIFPEYLEVEELGLFRFLIDTSMLLFPFISLGIHNLSVRMFPQFKDEKNGHNGLLFFLLTGVIGGYLFFLIIAFGLKPLLLSLLASKSALIQTYWIYLLPLAGLTILGAILTQWTLNFKKIVIPAIFNDLYIKIGMPIIAIIYSIRIVSLKQAIYLLIGVFVFRIFSFFIYINNIKQWHLKPNWAFLTKPLKKEMGVYSFYGLLGSMGSMFATRIDVFMVAMLATDELVDVGIYTTAFFIANIITVPARAINNIASPVIAESYKDNDMANIKMIYQKSSIILMTFGILFLIGIWASIDDLFLLMPKGEIFAKGKYVILVLGLGKLFDLATGANSEIIAFSKWFRFNFYAVLILAVVNVICNYLLIPVYQINGAAIATTFSLVLFNVSKYLYIHKKMDMQPFTFNTLKLLIIGLVAFFVGSAIPSIGSPFFDIVIRSVVISLLYVGAVWYLKISKDLNELMEQAVGKVWK